MRYQTKIVSEEEGLNDFFDLPFRLYRDDPNWVPPLLSEVKRVLDARKNPYFRGVDLQKFVCYRDKLPVARSIVVINPKHWLKFGQKVAFFGFFESEQDVIAVKHLFGVLEAYCAEQGAELIEGPFNPNHYSELGLLVKNFDPPAFFEPYNPPYYADLLKESGFEPREKLHTRIIRYTKTLAGKDITATLKRAQKAGFSIRPFNLLHYHADLEWMREVFNDSFDDNWHFLSVSREEYRFLGQSMFLITNPGLVIFVEHEGRPVGVLQFVLNVNPLLKQLNGRLRIGGLLRFVWDRFFIREIVLFAGGIKKEYRQGLAVELFEAALFNLARRYRVVYGTWMSDTNTAAIKAAERVGFVPYRWFEIFQKPVKTHLP